VHTVVETPEYLKASAKAGMTETERDLAVAIIAADPAAGDRIEGGGGIRKVRIPRTGGGKSGGYRVVTYYMDEDEPVFLLTVISKGQRSTFTPGQTKALKGAAKDEKKKRGTP
jgi:hypothetical protein